MKYKVSMLMHIPPNLIKGLVDVFGNKISTYKILFRVSGGNHKAVGVALYYENGTVQEVYNQDTEFYCEFQNPYDDNDLFYLNQES